jgi:hypothetical protein
VSRKPVPFDTETDQLPTAVEAAPSGTWDHRYMGTREFEATTKRCPNCGGELEFEVDIESLLGGAVDRTAVGYNCVGKCRRKFHPHEVP